MSIRRMHRSPPGSPTTAPNPGQFAQSLNGYELPIAMEVRRGRYLKSFEQPHAAQVANQPTRGTSLCATTTTSF